MPAFGGQLSEDEIQAIAQYVVDNRDPNAEETGGRRWSVARECVEARPAAAPLPPPPGAAAG